MSKKETACIRKTDFEDSNIPLYWKTSCFYTVIFLFAEDIVAYGDTNTTKYFLSYNIQRFILLVKICMFKLHGNRISLEINFFIPNNKFMQAI